MNEERTMHAMGIDDAYRVERVLARGERGATELVTLDGYGPFVRKRIPSALADRRVWAALAECDSDRLPHIAATYEMPDQFVAVYTYIPGDTLETYVEAAGRLDASQACAYTEQLCEALASLHGQGVIHRDLSPANLIVAADGVHVIDLGIARQLGDGHAKETKPLGTWGFASPEQFGFAQTDARSDIFAAGRILGYMLTGVRPDDDAYTAMLADENMVDAALRAVVERACAFEPSARYQRAEDLADAVRRALRGAGDASAEAFVPASESHPAAAGRTGGRGISGALSIPGAAVDAVRRRVEAAGERRRLKHRERRRQALIAAGICIAVSVALILFAVWQGRLEEASLHASASQDALADGGGSNADMPDAGQSDLNTWGAADATDLAHRASSALSLDESGWSADASGYVHYGVILTNASKDIRIEFPSIRITGRAEDGSVLFADTQVLSVIMPGETLGYGGQAGNGTAPASVEFEVEEPADYNVALTDASGARFEVGGLKPVDNGFGGISFTGEVELVDAGESKALMGDAAVSVILRDDQGSIIYGTSTFVDMPKEGEAVPFETLDSSAPREYASAEAYGMVW